MAGFFFNIQSLLGAKYSGRYFSLLLRELAIQDKKAFARAFELSKGQRDALLRGDVQIEREWRFDVGGQRRHADLALLHGGEPTLLIEVKEDDPPNLEQVRAYLDYVRAQAGGTRFVYVSRYPATPDEQSALKEAVLNGLPVRSLRYRDIYQSIEPGASPFACLLLDYMEDIGVASYQVIDLEAKEVSFFLAQALGFPHLHGLGRLHSQHAVDELPYIFRKMFGNLEGPCSAAANQCDPCAHGFRDWTPWQGARGNQQPRPRSAPQKCRWVITAARLAKSLGKPKRHLRPPVIEDLRSGQDLSATDAG